MTHFAVMVIGNDVEDQLAPFEESPEDDDSEFLEFDVKIKAGEEQEAFEKWKVEYKDKHPELHKKYTDWKIWMESWHGYSQNDSGDWGYTHNPNARWDWYQIGGRWSGRLLLKAGSEGERGEKSWWNENQDLEDREVDQALKKDIDWEGMRIRKLERRKKAWEEAMQKIDQIAAKNLPFKYALGQIKSTMYFEYGIEIEDTYEDFVNGDFELESYIMDKEWHENHEMGWWGLHGKDKMDQEEWRSSIKKLLDNLPDDTLITIVDCHI